MPQVAAMIERDYHVTPVLADPDEAVAKGAAIYAGNEKAFNDFVASEAAKSAADRNLKNHLPLKDFYAKLYAKHRSFLF